MLWFNFILGINLIFLCFKPLSYITNIPTQRKINRTKIEPQHIHGWHILWASSPGRSGGGAWKGRRACNSVSGIWIPRPIRLWLPVDGRLSCQISANQREAETSANVSKHRKIPAKGDDFITISANQHFASLLQASDPPPQRPRELARKLRLTWLVCLSFLAVVNAKKRPYFSVLPAS